MRKKNWWEAEKTWADSRRQEQDCCQLLAVLYLTLRQILLPRNENLTEKRTLSLVHKHFLPMWACLTCAVILLKVKETPHLYDCFPIAIVCFSWLNYSQCLKILKFSCAEKIYCTQVWSFLTLTKSLIHYVQKTFRLKWIKIRTCDFSTTGNYNTLCYAGWINATHGKHSAWLLF